MIRRGFGSGPVRCEFTKTSQRLTRALTIAIVDQVCASADVDAVLLQALDFPLVGALDALAASTGPVRAMTVAIDGDLRISIDFEAPISVGLDPRLLLGEMHGVVSDFFERAVRVDAGHLHLEGTLR